MPEFQDFVDRTNLMKKLHLFGGAPRSNKVMRLNILISAYYCSPFRGGESAVGWKVATGLAKHHDVTVICGDLSKDGPTGVDIARYKQDTGLPTGLRIEHLQAEGLTCIIHDLHALPGLWFLYYEAYRRWQLQAFDLALKLHNERPFDAIHHVNVIGFREPGYLWKLDIPFFWGPVSGAAIVPRSFLKDFSAKEQFRWGTRNMLNRLQIRRAGRPAEAARAARKVWGVSKEDCAAIALWGVKADPMLEAGCSPVENRLVRQREEGEPLRLCWSGRFDGIKALPLLLRALSGTEATNITLDILGSGSEEPRWRKLANQLGVNDRIHWHGMLPRDQALSIMELSHVLVHTSVKEGTPHVVLEALSMGLPVVCHDACGMGTAVTEDSGIKINLIDPATSEREIRNAIHRLLNEAALLTRISAGATKRADELKWDNNLEIFMTAYRLEDQNKEHSFALDNPR